RLRRDPHQITTLEVIRSIDGPVFLTSCFTAQGECGLSQRCNVKEPLKKVHDGIHNLLQSMTIADMCDEEELAGPGCGPIDRDTLTLLTVA
ncbi:MAG: Rrf2 family transcriptional regulator, partial [Bryobacteraceae bacterium]